MARRFPTVPFERYADDVTVHCRTLRQANHVRQAIANRMVEVGLRLHPTKTKVVYCKDGTRRGEHEHTAFTFLGYTFRARAARNERQAVTFTGFLPAVSKDATNKISAEIRRWRVHRKTGQTLNDLARWINPIVRGWMQYYGAFHRSALYPLLQRINAYLVRWLRKKYKRLQPLKKAKAAWQRGPASTRRPSLTGHGCTPSSDQDDRSRVTGDCYARICGGRRVRSPPPTRPS